jgi:hypothetical protein
VGIIARRQPIDENGEFDAEKELTTVCLLGFPTKIQICGFMVAES